MPVQQQEETHVGAPLDRQVFESWDDFNRYMEVYARRSFQLFRKRTSTSVKLRNRRLAERNKARVKPDDTEPLALIPEHYGNYSLTLVCTHSGAFVSRGTGRRSRQDVRAMHCSVQVNACLKLTEPKSNRYHVQVTRATLTHNHRVDKATFLQYSNTRLNLPDALVDCVELMRKTGMKARDIRAYITENSTCTPTLKDVQNLLQRLRSQDETTLAAAAAVAAAAESQQADGQEAVSTKLLPTVGIIQDEVLLNYAATEQDTSMPEPVDAATQFKVAHAMGKAVANLLAEVPPAEFSGAYRVIELARTIVCERVMAAGGRPVTMSTSEEEQSEAASGFENGLNVPDAGPSAHPLDERWP